MDKTPDASSALGRRARSGSVPRVQWDSPSSSRTAFNLRARREAEELEFAERRCREEHDERIACLRREEKIRQQDKEIRRRAPIPLKPRGSIPTTEVTRPRPCWVV